jgi:hypothetical protein
MNKIASLCISTILSATAIGLETNTANGSDPNTIVKLQTLDLDGFRYIKELHEKVGVHVFWNNGVYGKGLMLSFFGELDSTVLNAHNIKATNVVLADGTHLSASQIRQHKDAIMLGKDKRSIGFWVDLDIPRITNIKSISGEFEIRKAAGGITEITSGLLEDRTKSAESKVQIKIDVASDWMNGRYYVLIIPNAENILALTVLDENGNELRPTDPYSVFGQKNDHVKLYVEKKKGAPFAIKLKRSDKIQVEVISFALQNINLMNY